MKEMICLITDAWFPQVNGVVTTLSHLDEQLGKAGYKVNVIDPSKFKTFSLPTYNEIKVPWNVFSVYRHIQAAIDESDSVHIATEGLLGLLARIYCHRNDIPYLTSYHTKIPEYINIRFGFISLDWGYKLMRWMHNRAIATLVTTKSMKNELKEWGIDNTVVWNRGVDTDLFQVIEGVLKEPEPPILGYVGRVSIEKNMEAFLDLPDSLGKKVVVGDGPDLKKLKVKYPDVEFVGYKFDYHLVEWYNKMHVMVFPSKSDTFGLVNLEAMACGTPVAAFPVTGPKDIIEEGVNGSMSNDLEAAVKKCLTIDRKQCRLYVKAKHSWSNTLLPYVRALFGEENVETK